MAKLLAYYSLCPINDIKEFLGLSQDVQSGSVINTLGRNIVIIVKLSNQKQIRSWTALDRLTNKVVYDFHSHQYIGVFGHRNVKCWNEEVTDLKKIKKIKFSNNIKDLITFENSNTIVLYEDGKTESLASALKTRKSNSDDSAINVIKAIIDPTKQTIFNPAYFTTVENDVLMTYFASNTKSETIQLVFFKIDKDRLMPTGQVYKIKVHRGEQDVKLMGYTVVDGAKYPSLISIWSDKRVFMQQLRDDGTIDTDGPGQFVSMLNIINVEQPLSVIGISKDYVAIYGANENQEGSSLILYNTQFKVTQSKQFFKVYFNNSRLWIIENNILLAAGQTLAVIPFRISKEQLSDMVGSQRYNGISDYIDIDYINEEDELEQAISFDSNVQQVKSDDDEEMKPSGENNGKVHFKMYKSLKHLKKIEPVENFDNYFRILQRQNVFVELLKEKTIDTIEVKLFNNPNGFLIMDDEFEMMVTELEKCGASEIEITDKLIPLLINTDSSNDLKICLRRYTTISEKMLIKSLCYAIKSDVKKVDLLNTILSVSFDNAMIIQEIRSQLSLVNVLWLLNYLYELITKDDVCLEELPSFTIPLDEDEKILAWFATILDSHYQQCVLSRDTNIFENLCKWQNLIDKQIGHIRELKSFAPTLYNVVNKKAVSKENKFSKWYSIETVKLY